MLLTFSSYKQSLGPCAYTELRLSVNCVWVANLQSYKTSAIQWKAQECNQREINAQKGISLPLLSYVGEAGNTSDVVHSLRDELPSLEEALSQMGTSSKMPFHFTQCGRSLSEWSLSPEHWQSNQQKKIGLIIASELE